MSSTGKFIKNGLDFQITKVLIPLTAYNQIMTKQLLLTVLKKSVWNPDLLWPGDQLFGCRNTSHASLFNSPSALCSYYRGTTHSQTYFILLYQSHSTSTAVFLRIPSTDQLLPAAYIQLLPPHVCFPTSRTPFVFIVCSLVWNAQEEFLYLRNFEIKNVCNLRVLVESGEITERGETWQSCNTHCSWAFTSGEKLEYATKSNIECNSGISKDIWCHKSMYYYIWIYKYVFFCSFILYFYCSLWWSDDCLQEKNAM